MKKMLAIVCAIFLLTGAYARNFEVNKKVLQSFHETFASAEEVKWVEYKTYYRVSFLHAGIRTKVNYNKEGFVLGSLRYYSPQMLPLNIYNKLRREYSTKEFFGVTEVTSGTEIAYFVKMQDKKNWITLKLDASGNGFIYEKYKKAS